MPFVARLTFLSQCWTSSAIYGSIGLFTPDLTGMSVLSNWEAYTSIYGQPLVPVMRWPLKRRLDGTATKIWVQVAQRAACEYNKAAVYFGGLTICIHFSRRIAKTNGSQTFQSDRR
jgi:hypothetical protein